MANTTQKIIAFLAGTFFSSLIYSQVSFQIPSVPGIKTQTLSNANFREFYEIMLPQDEDHNNPGKKFNQRIYVGINDVTAPVVIETDGYALNYVAKNDYTNELAQDLKANLIVVEHRYFGKSLPDSMNWKYLTVKQAADDYHYIKEVFGKLFTGKWISTGISKGGQAALAYKLFFPEDVSATLVYGAAVKKQSFVDTDSLLFTLGQTPCGLRQAVYQRVMLYHKTEFLPYFITYVTQKKLDFAPMEAGELYDRLVLEFPFSFWQNAGDCNGIPDSTAGVITLVNYLNTIVPPYTFSNSNKSLMQPAFYMFYKELGYYEYSTEKFKNYLEKDEYSNKYFCPVANISYDNAYQQKIKDFAAGEKSGTVFFLYGQDDPWAMQTAVTKNKIVVKNGNHKSRMKDLPKEEREELLAKIRILAGK